MRPYEIDLELAFAFKLMYWHLRNHTSEPYGMHIQKLFLTAGTLLIAGAALISSGCLESKAKSETTASKVADSPPKAAEACEIVLAVSGMS